MSRLTVNRKSKLLATSDRLSILGLKIPYVRKGLRKIKLLDF